MVRPWPTGKFLIKVFIYFPCHIARNSCAGNVTRSCLRLGVISHHVIKSINH